MTTDPEPLARSARRRWPGASVRTRITAALAALALVAFAPAGLIVYLIERARIDNAVAALADQELAEFEKFQADARDPTTGRPFTDVAGLITRFLTRNVPGDDELLVGWWNDDAQIGSSNDALANAPAFDEAVRRHLDAGGTKRITSNGVQYQVTVQPVRNRETRGALVVSVNLDQAYAELNSTMRTYAIVAALSLGLITALAFWQAGRLLAPVRTLRDTTREITATDLSRRIPVTGNDDLTALSVTFNDMLDRLDAAFTTQREFLDDAGHELKTPLTGRRPAPYCSTRWTACPASSTTWSYSRRANGRTSSIPCLPISGASPSPCWRRRAPWATGIGDSTAVPSASYTLTSSGSRRRCWRWPKTP